MLPMHGEGGGGGEMRVFEKEHELYKPGKPGPRSQLIVKRLRLLTQRSKKKNGSGSSALVQIGSIGPETYLTYFLKLVFEILCV